MFLSQAWGKEVRRALKIKALVVDDSSTDRHLPQSLLARKLGCKVTAVEDGLEALNKLSSETYQIVLLDMLMPIMNGTEVLLEIRLNLGLCRIARRRDYQQRRRRSHP